jgi:hypothetical protein
MRRYPGWTVEPRFGGGESGPVAISLDDQFLTEWRGEPAQLWRVPFAELRGLEIVMGRRVRLRATIAGVRYTWSTRRSGEHDDLSDEVRLLGGRVVRPRRVVGAMAAAVAVVLLAASAATVVTRLVTHESSPVGTASVGTLRATDVPAGWRSVSGAPLDDLDGAPGTELTERQASQPLVGAAKQVQDTVASSYEHCVGVSAASDRLFGKAGVIPAYQVTGPVYATSAFKSAELGAFSQYYERTSDVDRDEAQYSNPRFGRCLAAANGQFLLSALAGSVSSASTVLLGEDYRPRLVADGWARGGTVPLTLPNGGQKVTLVSVLLASGHDEVEVNMIVGSWPAARTVVDATVASVLGRISSPSTSVAA